MSQFYNSSREQIFRALIAKEIANPNQQWLAKIVASWLVGDGVLPDFLGLEPPQFETICAVFFSGLDIPSEAFSGSVLDYTRMSEKDDLINLLKMHAREKTEDIDWVIGMIVSSCLGNDHLWQDLGVWQRGELTAFLTYNFPTLARRNSKDMKWKKFLYKQLCETEGIYLCRAPSCEVCSDYSNCFGSEE